MSHFSETFRVTKVSARGGEPFQAALLDRVAGYRIFAEAFTGASFDDGLYRFHDASSGALAVGFIHGAYPHLSANVAPFGFDWLGRQFVLDSTRQRGGQPLVLLLEPGTGEALEIPFTFDDFHEQLDGLREPALASSFFDAWTTQFSQSVPLEFDTCVGYRVPLFLGGSDDVDNLEVIDTDVYWTLSGQLITAVRASTRGEP